MFNLKSKFRFIMPVLIFSAMPLIAEEVPNYATADVIVSMDKKDNNKKSLGIEWGGGHTEENWFMNLGIRMREDIFDFAGNIGLKDSYFKNYPVQLGSTLEAYYHIRFIKINEFEQNIFTAGSVFVDIVPSNSRLTVYFGAGLKGNYLAVDANNPPQWNAYPIVSIFLTQKFSNIIVLNAGLRTFSPFISTAFIEPQFFANININITPKITLITGIEGIYNSYRKLEDLRDNTESLELQTLNFNAGIKYNF